MNKPMRPPGPPQADVCQEVDGWWWDGRQWLWVAGPSCPPPPCPPHVWPPSSPCPPGPPDCGSKIAKADACWDASKELYDFLYKVISDIFANDPSIIPTPPPSGGGGGGGSTGLVGPWTGDTSGNPAAAGDVGEYVTNTVTGTLSQTNGFATTFSALTLTAGDWDVWSSLTIQDTSADAQFWSGITLVLSMGTTALCTTDLRGAWNESNGIGGGTFNTNAAQALSAAPILISAQLNLDGFVNTIPGNFSCTTYARRRR